MDLVGFGKLAFDVIVKGQTTQLMERLVILIVIFGVAIGITYLGIQAAKWGNPIAILQVYTYLYAFLMAITYTTVAIVLNSRNYSQNVYVGFWAIIIAELTAFVILRQTSNTRDSGWFAVPIVFATLVHFGLILWTYIINQT